jgi:hypothetical protein
MTTPGKVRRYRTLVTAGAVIGLLAGCTALGPSAVQSGRLAYNEAISETNNQQMLMAVVHNRYDETAHLLAVASVTANVRVTTSTRVQLGFGDSDNYAGNLVPFSAGAIYEENPTISYTPVAGAKYARQVASPIPLSVLVQLTGTLTDPAYVYSALVSSVNGIRNPDFLFGSTRPDPRFDRFVTIMTTLARAHRLHWISHAQQSDGFSMVIDNDAPEHEAMVRELHSLLGLPLADKAPSPIVLPVSLALHGRNSGGVGITTRSLEGLVEILSAAIEVPEDDRRNGVAANYPPSGPPGHELTIHYSPKKPARAAVAVQYRNGWFYIDESDQATKRFFRLLVALWSVRIAESTPQGSASPLLTVPVSR